MFEWFLLLIIGFVASLAQTTPAVTEQEPRPVEPRHVSMWKIHAPVVPVELDNSTLVPPADPKVVGWWGKRAGARHGTTLLTGHTVHTGGGTLDDLENTPPGSLVRVSGVEYRVHKVRVVSVERLAEIAPRLFSQIGRPKLVIVTCEGYDWDTGIYVSSAIVIARPIEE